MTLCQRSKVILRNVPSAVTPASSTSTSTGPSSLRTLSNAARVDSQSATLPSDAWTSNPCARMSAIHFPCAGNPARSPPRRGILPGTSACRSACRCRPSRLSCKRVFLPWSPPGSCSLQGLYRTCSESPPNVSDAINDSLFPAPIAVGSSLGFGGRSLRFFADSTRERDRGRQAISPRGHSTETLDLFARGRSEPRLSAPTRARSALAQLSAAGGTQTLGGVLWRLGKGNNRRPLARPLPQRLLPDACADGRCRLPGPRWYIVDELGACQRARGDGFVAGFTRATVQARANPGIGFSKRSSAAKFARRDSTSMAAGCRSTTGTNCSPGCSTPTCIAETRRSRLPRLSQPTSRRSLAPLDHMQMKAVLDRIRRHERIFRRALCAHRPKRWLALAERFHHTPSWIR